MSKNISAKPIKFNDNGKLKIMHITDTHLSDNNIEASLFLIDEACRREMPDIAVITGDNVDNCNDSTKTKSYIDRLMNVFESKKIPVSVTFGNHDSERGAMSREELMAYYNTFSCSHSVDDGDALSGCGTYTVPVMSSDNSKIAFNLWIFDSNDYDEKGRYGCVLADQVEWYKAVSDELCAQNGGKKVYSLAFQHMIVPEVYDALKKVKRRTLYSFAHMYNKNDYYTFRRDVKNFGTFNETPCCGFYNYGQFDAMAEKGDVLAIFSGHDHTNAFGVRHKNIDIVNSLSTRSQSDRFSSQYGYRIIEVDENDTSKYSCRVERWYSMFTLKDILSYKKSGNSKAFKVSKNVTFRGWGQKFMTKTGRTFSQIVTGRRVTYKD